MIEMIAKKLENVPSVPGFRVRFRVSVFRCRLDL
jgi:hypothetical protein